MTTIELTDQELAKITEMRKPLEQRRAEHFLAEKIRLEGILATLDPIAVAAAANCDRVQAIIAANEARVARADRSLNV
jgi:hypothetical protein